MTRNLTFISTDRIFNVSWLPWINWKIYVSLFCDGIQTLGGKKLFIYPPPLRKFAPLPPLYPLEFPWPSMGGMDIFWNHTKLGGGKIFWIKIPTTIAFFSRKWSDVDWWHCNVRVTVGLLSWYYANQEKKRVTCPPFANSFNFSQGPGRRRKKERDSSHTIPCSGPVLNLFRTEANQIVYPV